jgi:hypothetical protein
LTCVFAIQKQQNYFARKMTHRPKQRRSFLGPSDERNYLRELLEYFKLRNETKSKAVSKYLQRFERLLNHAGLDDGSILLQNHWALFHEFRGDIERAIFHREREIKFVNRLLTKYGPAKSSIPIYSIDDSYLRRTMRLLHRHYIAVGKLKKATGLVRRLNTLENRRRKKLGA